VHTVRFTGSNVDLKSVTVQGSGGRCSFDETAGFKDAAETSYLYRGGLDAVNRLFGPDRDFSKAQVKQHYFAMETVGKNEDGSISTIDVSDGMWKYIWLYSQDASPDDLWLNKPEDLWAEHLIKPWLNVSLGYVPGHSGQQMTVAEPCNILSANIYHEATVWIACKGHHFTRDEYASLMASLNALAPGTAFNHACACKTGGRADTFAMDWVVTQSYQILVREVINAAGNSLTDEEKHVLFNMGSEVGSATELSKNLTKLFRGPYNREVWYDTFQTIPIPDFTSPVAGHLIFAMYALAGSYPIPGLESFVHTVLNTLLDIFPMADADWIKSTYMPTVQKALGAVTLCSDAASALLEHTLKFTVTFVEALVYQEKMIPLPPIFKDVAVWLDRLGVLTDALSDMARTWDIYNGFDCLARSDHAIWHEKAAHGFVHMFEMADTFANRVRSDAGQC
jgi:hypothetical protein